MKQNKEIDSSKWFDIVLCEYNSLRTESAESLKNQQSIINYGLTVIGVLIGFTGGIWGQKSIVEIIYILFIPFICNLIILIWNGEVNRMSRAGQYINTIENKVNVMVKQELGIDKPALYWETYLRQPKREADEGSNKSKSKKNNKIKRNYLAIIGMFGLLSFVSMVIGIFHNYLISGQEFSKWTETVDIKFAILVFSILIINTVSFVNHTRYFFKVKK